MEDENSWVKKSILKRFQKKNKELYEKILQKHKKVLKLETDKY